MLDLNGKLRLHDDFKAATVPIGTEREPVVVVDNFLSSPQLLKDFAAAHGAFDAVSDTFYPGMRSPAPAIYCYALRAFLAPIIAQAFGLQDSRITGELSHFSLVLTPPEKLQMVQRMPHFDNTNPKQLALLHYLCGPEHGGTSFIGIGAPASNTSTNHAFLITAMRSAQTWLSWECRRQNIFAVAIRGLSEPPRSTRHSIGCSFIAASICTAPTSHRRSSLTRTRAVGV